MDYYQKIDMKNYFLITPTTITPLLCAAEKVKDYVIRT